jgi:hypothetical protein
MRFSRSYCDAAAHNNGLGAILQRYKIILLAAVCVAVARVLAAGFGGNALANVPAFAFDNALKGPLAVHHCMCLRLGAVQCGGCGEGSGRASLAVEAMGLLLAIWALRHLGRNWSGEITIKVELQLIRSGPYKLLRHPIYTGLLAIYAGTVLVTGEWLAIIGLAMARSRIGARSGWKRRPRSWLSAPIITPTAMQRGPWCRAVLISRAAAIDVKPGRRRPTRDASLSTNSSRCAVLS